MDDEGEDAEEALPDLSPRNFNSCSARFAQLAEDLNPTFISQHEICR